MRGKPLGWTRPGSFNATAERRKTPAELPTRPGPVLLSLALAELRGQVNHSSLVLLPLDLHSHLAA